MTEGKKRDATAPFCTKTAEKELNTGSHQMTWGKTRMEVKDQGTYCCGEVEVDQLVLADQATGGHLGRGFLQHFADSLGHAVLAGTK